MSKRMKYLFVEKIKRAYQAFASWQEHGSKIKPLQAQTVVCKHCGTTYEGNYCPRCGQSRMVSQITKRGFVAAFMEAYPQLASSFMRTILELLLRPGYMVRDVFRGHRVIYSGPFKSFIIIVSVFVLLAKLTGIPLNNSDNNPGISVDKPKREQVKTTDTDSSVEEKVLIAKVSKLENKEKEISTNKRIGPIWNLIKKKADEQGTEYLFLYVPFLALASKLAYRRRNFDGRQLIYAEHFMTFVYLYVVHICFCLFAFLCHLPAVGEASFDYPDAIIYFYVGWTFKGLYGFNWKETLKCMLRFLLWVSLFAVIGIISFIGVIVGLVYSV